MLFNHKMNFKLIFIFFILGFLLMMYLESSIYNSNYNENFQNKSHFISGSVANDNKSRELGLMYRELKLGFNRGMLFYFGNKPKSIKSVWMKNTFIPLDVLFIDSNFIVVDYSKNLVPFSEMLIKSKVKANHFIELDSGEIERLNIEIGDKIFFN